VGQREERDARSVGAECARAEARTPEPVRLEQPHLEPIPSAFRTYGEQHSVMLSRSEGLDHGLWRVRIGDDAICVWRERVELVLDEDPKLPVNGDLREPRITGLLQALY
jgi:hypothetical protein